MVKQERLKELLTYNKLTGKFTRLNSAPGESNAMDNAGSMNWNGYTHIQVDGRCYMAHRLAWIYEIGSIPEGMEIDHINHDKSDNRIENLRLITKENNLKNKSKYSSNSSGVNGVHWRKDKGKWQAKIRVNKKFIHLGYFNDIADAERARKKAEKEHGFHENHGL